MSSTDRPDARIDVAAGLRFHAVVPAAGRGERFGAAKQFVPVAGRPLLAWTVRRLREAGAASITLVLPADDLGDARRRLAADPEVICVAGGETRQASVALGVAASPAASADLVAV
ncbi:MAG: NTP transferase domain-containing protein, partial [Thermoanaerobaculia bacterium]